MAIQPVVLCGGVGKRLWPLSQACHPKPFHRLVGERTLLQATLLRVAGQEGFASPIVVGNAMHGALIAAQLNDVGVLPRAIILEPVPRNTAAAVAVAALAALRTDADAFLLVLPSDHLIGDSAAFIRAATLASAAARRGYVVTFGITPSRAESGYGYIEAGAALDFANGVHRILSFVEKPPLVDAARYATSGAHYWNSGMLLVAAAAVVEEIEGLAPGLIEPCRRSLESGRREKDAIWLGPEFSTAPSLSIDVALLERTRNGAVIPVDFGWTDLGSWSSLWTLADKDSSGNAVAGNAIVRDTAGVYVRSDGPLVVVSGVTDLVIIATSEGILVADRNRADEWQKIAEIFSA
jgi:mannose-1-phosphate guanylyltransferase/mannose-6-phosphate isomerase